MSTDQPQQPGPGIPAQPSQAAYTAPPAPPAGYPVYATAPQSPPPPAGSSSHVGVIIASIVGGLVLLGLAFGGGAVIGFAVGAHHGAHMVTQEQGWQGPGGFGRQHDGQGRWHQDERQQIRPGSPGDQKPTPVPIPTTP